MAIVRFKLVEKEGYVIRTDLDLNYCGMCGYEFKKEIFYFCEENKCAYCSDCNKKAPCHKARVSVIPTVTFLRESCIHKKIVGVESV